MYVIAVGNVFDGITLYGPYEDNENAQQIAELEFNHSDWHVIPLHSLEK